MPNLLKFIIGSIIGSFITLSSIRSFKKESVIFPSSHCDNCHHNLAPWELIPVISFLLLRGRCSHCHQPIGYFTFIGEIIGGVIILLNPLTRNGIIEISFQLLCLFISEQDYQHYSISSGALILLFLIIVFQLFLSQPLCSTYFLIITLFYGITLVVNYYYPFIGNGDLDFIFILILKTGLIHASMIITLGALLAIINYILHHSTKLIPFVPYLSLAYVLLRV